MAFFSLPAAFYFFLASYICIFFSLGNTLNWLMSLYIQIHLEKSTIVKDTTTTTKIIGICHINLYFHLR